MALGRADEHIAEHMLTVRRTYIERRLYGGDRGSLEYHR